MISESVLRRLLKQDVIQHIKLKGDEDKNDPKIYVFQEGKPVSFNEISYYMYKITIYNAAIYDNIIHTIFIIGPTRLE